jgi:hypothetical protein
VVIGLLAWGSGRSPSDIGWYAWTNSIIRIFTGESISNYRSRFLTNFLSRNRSIMLQLELSIEFSDDFFVEDPIDLRSCCSRPLVRPLAAPSDRRRPGVLGPLKMTPATGGACCSQRPATRLREHGDGSCPRRARFGTQQAASAACQESARVMARRARPVGLAVHIGR